MSSHHQPPAEEQVLAPSFDAELFWAKNQKAILGGVIALVVIVVGTVVWLINAHNSQIASAEQLSNAKDVAGWRAVIANYPHSMPAADAYFLLADALRKDGKVDESTAAYQDFLKAFPKHPLAPGANVGIAENLDLQGKSAEALTALREVQTGDSTSYAAPFAAFLEGRILIREGKLADAHRVLSTAYNLFPKSPAARAAGMEDNDLKMVLPTTEGKDAPVLR